jgi:hypothetical protein
VCDLLANSVCMQLRCGNPGCKYRSRKHCQHILDVAAEFKLHSALPDLSRLHPPSDRSAANEFLKLPDEPARSITDRPAPLPIPIAAKELMFKYKNPASLPAEGLMPTITPGQCCKTHKKPYEATFVGEANVFFSDARCTAKVYAYDCAKRDPKCQIPYKGDEHQLCVLTERIIVAEWLFYECFFHVSSSCVRIADSCAAQTSARNRGWLCRDQERNV